MKIQNVLLTVGAIASAAKIAKEATGIELDDIFGAVGLTRARNRTLQYLGLFGTGALVGAGTAMLLTPKSGPEARKLIRQQADRLGHAASEVMQAGSEAGRSITSRAQDALRVPEQKHPHS